VRPPHRRRDAHQPLQIVPAAVALRSLLQHLQDGVVAPRPVQDLAQLLAHPRRIVHAPQPIQAVQRLPIITLRGAVGTLAPGVVARHLQVAHGLVRDTGANVVIGQQLRRCLPRVALKGLGDPPVQHRPPRRAQIGLQHLADQVVREAIGRVPLFQ